MFTLSTFNLLTPIFMLPYIIMDLPIFKTPTNRYELDEKQVLRWKTRSDFILGTFYYGALCFPTFKC